MRLTTAFLAAGLCVVDATGAAAAKSCENTGSFEGWLAGFKSEATAQGIKPRTIATVLNGMTLDQTVISRDRKQSFFSQTFLDFSAKLATNNRVQSSQSNIRGISWANAPASQQRDAAVTHTRMRWKLRVIVSRPRTAQRKNSTRPQCMTA